MIARKGGQPEARKLMAQLDKHSVRVGGAIDVRLVLGSTLQHTDRLSSRAFRPFDCEYHKQRNIITTSQLWGCSFLQSLPLSVPSLSRSLLLRCNACGIHMVNTCWCTPTRNNHGCYGCTRRVFDVPVWSIVLLLGESVL